MADPEATGQWRTPGGHDVSMIYRTDTTDWNTISAILTHDEYTMPRGLSGLIVDVGSHVGAFAIGAALDNPDATVLAIEAIPENWEQIVRNTKLNGVKTLTAWNYAAGSDGQVAYGTTGEDFERQHRYIGGAIWQDGADRKVIDLPTMALAEIVSRHKEVAFLKIDCEGCEWSFLDDPAIASVVEISGEYHPRGGMGPARIRELLEPTHDVTLNDAEPFGPFHAVRR